MYTSRMTRVSYYLFTLSIDVILSLSEKPKVTQYQDNQVRLLQVQHQGLYTHCIFVP